MEGMDKHELPESSELVDDIASQRENVGAYPPPQANPPPLAAQVPHVSPVVVQIDAGLGAAVAQAITATMIAREHQKPWDIVRHLLRIQIP